MKPIRKFILLAAMCQSCINANDQFACMNGSSNQGVTLDKPYITQGKRAHIIGLQDGSFPDAGNHVRGEMYGVWTHPIKLADGFWLRVTDQSSGTSTIASSGEMVTYPTYNKFIYENIEQDIAITCKQFASDATEGVVVSYVIRNCGKSTKNILLDFILNTELSPVWYADSQGISNSEDSAEWDRDRNIFKARDTNNDWYMVWGSRNSQPSSYKIETSKSIPTLGKGLGTILTNRVDIKAGEELKLEYVIASSINSEQEAISRYDGLCESAESEFNEKIHDYTAMLSESKLTIPDKEIQEAYDWIRINTKWLEVDVENVGYFLTAGAIEYPWLFGCDNSYALQGLLCTGQFEVVESTLRALNSASERVNGNGRIIHEMNTFGHVGNPGNTQETAHFIVAVWRAYQWSGNTELVSELYPTMKKGIEWLIDTCDQNQNLYPEGNGIMEVKGLVAELIDVAVYTQQALEAMSKMATIVGDQESADAYQQMGSTMRENINNDFWDQEEQSYCDFLSTNQQAAEVTRGAIEQLGVGRKDVNHKALEFYNAMLDKYSSAAPKEYGGRFTNKNWVVSTPMEMKIAPVERAIEALEQVRINNCGEYGPYLSAVESSRMMTISTGVQAVAESNYGRADYAIDYLQAIASTLGRNMPGAINEMMPDYGCPVQAWTIYGVSTTLIGNIAGVQPDAYNREIIIKPQLPSSWDNLSLENVEVGGGRISIEVKRTDKNIKYSITAKDIDWNIKLIPIGSDEPIEVKEGRLEIVQAI